MGEYMQDDSNPVTRIRKMREALSELQKHLRDDIGKVEDAQFKAMFETAAEVLGGLRKAFEDYEKKNEAAWRS